ncbi:MAG: hypothetical protein FWH03_06260 [Firmicutes bacterium]|nr:hypothetical protein [Bacillota bacterium]
MKYINKEYGFAFRPPFNDKFYEEKREGPPLTDANFPGRCIFGAGYDFSAVNGAVLIGKNGSAWGIKVTCLAGNKWLDNDYFMHNLSASSANTADSSFARFAGGPLIAKWVRMSAHSAALKVSTRKKRLRMRVIFYPCYNFAGELSIDGAVVKGRSPHIGIIGGTIALTDNGSVFEGRKLAVCDSVPQREYFYAQSYQTPSDSANGAFNEAIMEFMLDENQSEIYIFASLGDETLFETPIPRLDKIAGQIETAELRCGVDKTMGTGLLGAPAERMLNAVLWSRIYYPYLLTEIYAPARPQLTKHFDLRGTQENCGALLGSLTDCETAARQLKFTIQDKIMALLTAWTILAKCTDKTLLLPYYRQVSKLYPPLAELVCSTSAENNEIAYKWEDSPLKNEGAGLALFSLDLSCLKALAFDILERMCLLLDLPDRTKYESAKKEMLRLINQMFWDEKRKIYANCTVTGEFSKSIGATSFYPLICGAVDTAEKLSGLMESLSDPKKFRTEFLIPTLCADDAEFGKRGKPNHKRERSAPFLAFRGSIVPYVNYLIYQGLVRYGLDEAAGALAASAAQLWANDNENNALENYAFYLPNGKKNVGREHLCNSGGLLAMLGICELLDVEYFRADLKTSALRFGTFVEGSHSLTNIKLAGQSYSIEVSDHATILLCGNAPLFRGEGGRFKVRNFLETRTGFEFMIDARSPITINLNSVKSTRPMKYYLIVPQGKFSVTAENGEVKVNKIPQET